MIQQALNELSQQIRIRPRYDNFIGGQWVAPVKGQYFTNLTPVTGKPLCEVARSTAEDIELALDAAHKAKDAWGKTSRRRARAASSTRSPTAWRATSKLLAMVETLGQRQADPRDDRTPTCRWPSTTSATSPAASAPRKARSPRSTTTPSPIISMSRSASSARSSRGTSRS